MPTSTAEHRAQFPDVYEWQWALLGKYGDLLTNTGGNEPADLLQRMQTPGKEPNGNRLASTNIVVFTLAVGIASQLSLLRSLERAGLIQPIRRTAGKA